jgi:DNA-binding CsgD family transcriptional regulator
VNREFEHSDVLPGDVRAAVARLLVQELAAAWDRALDSGGRSRYLVATVAGRLERIRDTASRPGAGGTSADRSRDRNSEWSQAPLAGSGAMEDDEMARGFIGREAELDRLGRLLGAARERRPSTVVLTGQPGVGKSRLLEEFAGRAAQAGALVLRGECFELGDGLPYAPLVSALRLLDLEYGRLTRELAGPGWDQLSELISDFTGRRATARQVGVLGDRMPVHGAVMRVLKHLGGRRPVVLVFENMQWIDPSTLLLVNFLVHEKRDDHTLLICSTRIDLPQGHAFRKLLAEPDFLRRTEQMALDGFTEPEMREFLSDLGVSNRDELRRGFRLSGGNAFFAEELVRARVLDDPNTDLVPDLLQGIMLSRIKDLSRNAARLLSIAATAARSVSYLLLATVSKLGEEELEDALRECLDQAMLVPDQTNGDAFVFHSALLRQATYKHELKHNQTKWHTVMAEAITANTELSLDRDQDAAVELAHHWYRADRKPEALVSALRAGAVTARIRAFDEADVQYRRALELWAQVPGPERLAGAAHEDVLTAAADVARWAGHGPRAVELVTAAISEVDAEARPRRAGELHERLGSYLWESGQNAESAEAYREAWRLLTRDPVDDAVDARVLAGLAMADIRADRFTEGLNRALEADGIARRAGAPAESSRSKNTAGLAYTLMGQASTGVPLLREALEIARRTGQLEILFRVYANLGLALLHTGDLTEAASIARQGLDKARSQGLSRARQTGTLANNVAVALLLLGRWPEAVALLEEMLADRPPVQESAYLRLTYAEVELARGNYDKVQLLLAQVGAMHKTDPRFLAALHGCRAELALWRDADGEAALAAVEQGLAVLAEGENSLGYLRLCAVGARAAADLRLWHPGAGRAETLSRSFSERAPYSDGQAPPSAEHEVTLWQCAAERERANSRDDAGTWARIAAAWTGLSRPFPAGYAGWRQAQAALRAGNAAAAGELAEALLAVAQDLGAEPLCRELRGVAQAAAVAAGPSTPASAALLSSRQLEVVRLIARGLSDMAIARQLGIAPGTVSRQGYDARQKIMEHEGTHISSRMMLANWAREHGLLEEPENPDPTTKGEAP